MFPLITTACYRQNEKLTDKRVKCAILFFLGVWFFLDLVSLTRFRHFNLASHYLFFLPLPLDINMFSLLKFSIYLTLCSVCFLVVLSSLRCSVILVCCGFSSYLSCHLSPVLKHGFWLRHGTWRYHLRNLDCFELLSTWWDPESCLCHCQWQMILKVEVEEDPPLWVTRFTG